VGIVMYGHSIYCRCEHDPDVQSGQPQSMGLVGE